MACHTKGFFHIIYLRPSFSSLGAPSLQLQNPNWKLMVILKEVGSSMTDLSLVPGVCTLFAFALLPFEATQIFTEVLDCYLSRHTSIIRVLQDRSKDLGSPSSTLVREMIPPRSSQQAWHESTKSPALYAPPLPQYLIFRGILSLPMEVPFSYLRLQERKKRNAHHKETKSQSFHFQHHEEAGCLQPERQVSFAGL